MEKVKGQLKNISGEFLGQDLRFLCPHVTLPFFVFFFIPRARFVVKCPYMSPLNICCVQALKKTIFQWFGEKIKLLLAQTSFGNVFPKYHI